MSSFKPTLLLHACCGTCAAFVIEELQKEYEVTVFIYNPNIHPIEEYMKRVKDLVRYAEDNRINFVEYKYDAQNWFKATKGLEAEPEGGKRCEICFWLRLAGTADYADTYNFDFFATTLSVSPHKNTKLINKTGEGLAREYGVGFLTEDFKKNDGYKKACEKAREYKFYRQVYCGCLYSKAGERTKK